jgi:excisionase family DNA binding protein
VTLFDGAGDQIWTVAEVAAVLDYSERYIRTQAEAGVLPSFRVGDELMFSKAELEQWFMKLKIMMRSIDDAED